MEEIKFSKGYWINSNSENENCFNLRLYCNYKCFYNCNSLEYKKDYFKEKLKGIIKVNSSLNSSFYLDVALNCSDANNEIIVDEIYNMIKELAIPEIKRFQLLEKYDKKVNYTNNKKEVVWD